MELKKVHQVELPPNSPNQLVPKNMEFVELFPSFWKLTLPWSTGLYTIPCSVFLIENSDNEFILIDAGYDSHASELVQKVASKIGNSTLKMVFITHGHVDHVAALPQLLEMYPDCKLGLSQYEAKFLTGESKYSDIMGDHPLYNLAKYGFQNSKTIVDKSRMEFVSEGDVFGNVKVVETFGHTPGSLSYLHLPSNYLMVGDAIMNLRLNPFAKCPSCSVLKPSTAEWKSAVKSIQKICDLDAKLYLPAHDDGNGISKETVLEYLKSQTK
jgi:glyoxylase-like metal-dependent hydrolase (beta-lactamase superfamily II)